MIASREIRMDEILIPAEDIPDWDLEPKVAKCLSIGGRYLINGVAYKATGWVFCAHD